MNKLLGRGLAPGKVILFGEHAVVYGRPALAVPVAQVYAVAEVWIGLPGRGLTLEAIDLGETIALEGSSADHPLAYAARLALDQLGIENPDWRLTLHSTIPIASGMGSGAAASTAVIWAIAAAAGRRFTPEQVSAMVFRVERIHHGTPSGVDNTVIAFCKPVYFVQGQPPLPFGIGEPFLIAIADTGIGSPTHLVVADVRANWENEPRRVERLFDQMALVAESAQSAIVEGRPAALGPLMDENQRLLQLLGVSSPELDSLTAAARSAGALGAKLSGAGRGGNLIALVSESSAAAVVAALRAGGARNVILTKVADQASGGVPGKDEG